MMLIALILAACGAILSRWLKVLILVPASHAVWGIAIVFGWMQSFSIIQTIATVFFLTACLHFGYFGGAVFANVLTVHRKRRSRSFC